MRSLTPTPLPHAGEGAPRNPLIVIGGPTATGKSALAVALAREFSGIVVNGDSLQVYDALPILTARPGAAEQALVPHRLYAVLSPEDACSAGRWRELATAECRGAWAAGRLPVVVGGTGLYLKALTDGLSPIPDIPDSVRQAARDLFQHLGNQAFHDLLAGRDPLTASCLAPGNSQRLMRAWEVLEATGRPLADWQQEPPRDRLDATVLSIALLPTSEQLYPACDGRFLRMLADGALDEVRDFQARGFSPVLPVGKVLGLSQLADHLRGACRLEAAVARAQQATRNYAKRQRTWFRHQMVAGMVVDAQFSESFLPKIFSFIRQFLLTGARCESRLPASQANLRGKDQTS